MNKIVNDVNKLIDGFIYLYKPTNMFRVTVHGRKWEMTIPRDRSTVFGPLGPIGKFGLGNPRKMKYRGSRYDDMMEEVIDIVHKGKFELIHDPSCPSSSRVLIRVDNKYYGNLLLLNKFDTFCIKTNKLTAIEKFVLLQDNDIVERGPLLMKIGE